MIIRAATPADAPAIHRVSVASCRAEYIDALDDPGPFLARVADPSRIEALRDRLETVAENDKIVYLVADDGAIVGFVQVLAGERTPEGVPLSVAYLKSLYVHPDRWNEGIGSHLLDTALTRLPDTVERVRLGVLAANEAGKRFYERRGFEHVDDGTFKTGGRSYSTEVYARSVE